jgi:hypothetical protein
VKNFESLLLSVGFASTRVWTDPKDRFAVFWAMA